MTGKEIGGYIELDRYSLPMPHENAIKLNCARNALAYIIKAKKIKSIYMPKFMCSSCDKVLKDNDVSVNYYSVCADFKPCDVGLRQEDWFYFVNYYGQFSNEYITELKNKYDRIIADNVQAYYQPPVDNVDTLYTCRKFFGVPDGAMLYTNTLLDEELPTDESCDRMGFLLGRFERTASEFYGEYVSNEKNFDNEPIKRMSKLTENLLHGIDHEHVKTVRRRNFAYLHERLGKFNKLALVVPEGAFMYPLYIDNGAEIRKKLQAKKIYIPTLWSNVFETYKSDEPAYDMAANILPLSIDQRYGEEEMEYMAEELFRCMN